MSRSRNSTPAPSGKLQLHILLIVGVSILAWSNSFHGPFVFDDRHTIVENLQIRNLSGFLTDPSLFFSLSRRFLGYLSFAMNYRIGGLSVGGYHAVNLALHSIAALMLYLLCRTLLQSAPAGRNMPETAVFPPLAAALLFVSHPVQTQAVSYITQRFTILSTLFCLITLFCYAKARMETDPGTGRCYAWFTAGIISALCAMLSKENAATLPVSVLAMELFSFAGPLRRRVALLAPYAALLLVVPLLVMLGGAVEPEISRMATGDSTPLLPSHSEYVVTQAAVAATYLRLLLLPVNQSLDYDYPIYNTIGSFPVIVGILLLSLSLLAAVLLYRRGTPHARVAGFGICWFWISLSVEAFVPLADLINEHRLYMPLAGAALFAASAIPFASRIAGVRAVRIAVGTIVAVLAMATWKRNLVWSDEMLLWNDTAEKAPGKARPHYNLGIVLSRGGLTDAAEQEFHAALSIEPDHARARYNLGVLKGAKGDYAAARKEYEAALRIDPGLAEAHNSMGALLAGAGDLDAAVAAYRKALQLSPQLADAHNNLGAALAAQGKPDAALTEFSAALKLDPQNRTYRENMQRALRLKKDPAAAVK